MSRRVLLVAGGASLLFGVIFLALYQAQLERERGSAAVQVNRLLQVSLENAMLKRDVPGLREIVRRMGQEAAIRDVLIVEPGGEVRFASDASRLGQRLPEVARLPAGLESAPEFRVNERGQEVLRSINPVPNREACIGCHGPVARHPVNGILVVDYDAAALRRSAYHSAIVFGLAGSVVLALTLLVLWRFLRREVIEPVNSLDRATRRLAGGDLTVRAPPLPSRELGRMGENFNRMADRLVEQLELTRGHERFLQELLDSLPDGVRVIRQQDFQVQAANAAFCRQLDRSLAELLHRPCYAGSHGRDAPCPPTMVVCPIQELQVPGQSLRCQHHHRRADGGELPVDIHAVLIAGQSGERLIIESARDLSGVARLSQEQRLSELGLLAAGIAHEIHNPLASLRLAVEGLLRSMRSGQGDAAKIVGYLEMMNAEIDRCTGVTRRLLLLSKPPQAQPQVIRLQQAVADTVGLLEFDAQAHNIRQILTLDPANPCVLADDSDLRMVVLNIVQNAHHAMPRGGDLHIATGLDGDFGWVEIRDGGTGIQPEDLPHIFDPFFSHRADGEAGTGLGLTICRNIVERYGGRIKVESRYGEGSVFRIMLPAAEQTGAA